MPLASEVVFQEEWQDEDAIVISSGSVYYDNQDDKRLQNEKEFKRR